MVKFVSVRSSVCLCGVCMVKFVSVRTQCVSVRASVCVRARYAKAEHGNTSLSLSVKCRGAKYFFFFFFLNRRYNLFIY